MIWKTLIFLSLALCVLGDGPHAISEQRIRIRHKEHRGHHGELSHIGSKKLEHHEEYAWSYPSYEFSYSVHDPHTHDKKGQHESRKGDEVKGEYWLIEPDGRKRTVTYHVDKHSGFHAVVHYSDHHHHITEDHDHKDEDQKDDKGSDESDGDDKKHHDENKGKDNNENEGNERNNEDEDEKKDEGGEKKEENNEGVEEGEGNDDEERGGEETRGREGGVVRWGYSPKWDHRGHGYDRDDKRDRDERRRGNGHDGDDQRDGKSDRDEGRRGRGRDEDRDRDDDQYDTGKITVYEKLGPYGRRDTRKRDEKRKEEDRDREETLLWEERRKFDERRGYPSLLTPYFGHASRINPRFYRHNQQPSIAKRI